MGAEWEFAFCSVLGALMECWLCSVGGLGGSSPSYAVFCTVFQRLPTVKTTALAVQYGLARTFCVLEKRIASSVLGAN